MPHHPRAGLRTRAMRALTCLAILVCVPAIAAAQRDSFIDAAIAFRLSLAGTYGDEGRQLTSHLDRMSASLATWDRGLALSVSDLRSELANAPSDRASEIHIHLASRFVERGRLDEAVAELDAAIALDRDRAASHLVFRGLVREAAGAPGEALDDFRQAWTLDPRDPISAYLVLDRGGGAAPDGSSPQMKALLDALAEAANRPVAFVETALIEDRAAEWPVFAPAAYVEGFELFAGGRYVEAIERFRSVAARDPLLVDPAARDARLERGIAHVHLSQFEAAIGQFEAVAAAVPESSEARRLLAHAYAASGRDAEAIPHLEAALRVSPGDERTRLALARALMRLERWTDAEAALREAIDVLPVSGEARWILADLYEQRERWKEAAQVLEDAALLPMLAGRGPFYWRLGDLWQRLQDFDAVARVLSAYARLDPNYIVVHRELGLAYTRMAESDRALPELVMAAVLGAEDAQTLASIGQIHLESGRYAMSEAPLRRAIGLDPNHTQARYALGTALLRLGRKEEGAGQLAEYERLLEEERAARRRAFEEEYRERQAEQRTSEGR